LTWPAAGVLAAVALLAALWAAGWWIGRHYGDGDE
jgi:hypothetical protein